MPLASRVRQDGQIALDWSAPLAGMRGVAIALVVAAHLGLPLAGGGLAGVTAFFVLSGFLITTLLIAELDATGRVDIRAFYGRRARRLLPAFAVAVIAVMAVGAAVGHSAAVLRDSLLALTYVSNWARAEGDGVGLWNHAWSLAIEAQFYLVWPVVMVMVARVVPLRSWRAILALLALAAASAAWRVVLTAAGAPDDRVYFGTDTRAEALMIGCALACLRARMPELALPSWAGPAALLAVVFLAATPLVDIVWAGSAYTGVAVASAVLILSSVAAGAGGVGLGSRPMVWLGERSYSLYLWHVPVIMLLPGGVLGAGAAGPILAAAAISILLASLSYRYVERPFRRFRRLDLRGPIPLPGRRRSGEERALAEAA